MVGAALIGFDTNLLVRMLTGDDPAQEAQVRRRLATMERSGQRAFIPLVALAELGHVLAGPRYRIARARVADAVDGLLATALFVVEARDVVLAALADYRAGRGSLADHLIGRSAESAGAAATLTFDADLHGMGAFARP